MHTRFCFALQSVDWTSPAAQVVQAVQTPSSLYLPEAHATHCVRGALASLPALQLAQEEELADVAILPASHSVHVLPAPEESAPKWPALQVHLNEPALSVHAAFLASPPPQLPLLAAHSSTLAHFSVAAFQAFVVRHAIDSAVTTLPCASFVLDA